MVIEQSEPSPARPRVLARARRTAQVWLFGLVAAGVGMCWATTTVLLALAPDIGLVRLGLAHAAWLVALGGVVLLIARSSTAFLEDVFQQEDRIVAAVAHEVRSPVSRVLVSLEEGLAGLVDAQAALSDANREAQGLAQLIDDLLLAGQVLAGAVPPPRESVRVDPVVASVARTAAVGDATVVVDTEPYALVGSDRLLRLSLVNLVRNAVQHAYGGGPGVIRVQADEHGVAVIDDGPGIPEGRLRALLDQPCIGNPRSDTGLGLLIADWVAELHGGELRLSNRPGGGFEARLVLPVEPVDREADGALVGSGAGRPGNELARG